MNMTIMNWYSNLIKPFWAPPAWVFGPVWTFLYTIIAISYGYVGYLYFKGKIPLAILFPFILNLIFNFAFSPIQFVLQNNFLAMADIFLVLGTLIWEIYVIYPYAKLVAFVNIPYMLWVSFATILQITITWLNR